MALDLFKRVETRKGLFAVEKITLIYNLLTSILILFLFLCYRRTVYFQRATCHLVLSYIPASFGQ